MDVVRMALLYRKNHEAEIRRNLRANLADDVVLPDWVVDLVVDEPKKKKNKRHMLAKKGK